MLYIKKYYRKALVIIIPLIVFLILGLIITKTSNNSNIELMEDELINNNENEKKEENDEKTMKVNIKGAVVNPGVYSFSDGERVIDAINKSGGLLENADTSVINLSKNLFDEMVIIIYTFDEVKAMNSQNVLVKYVKEDCNCPSLQNDACLNSDNIDSNATSQNGKISLNTASLETLQTLPGIGLAKAKAIIEYREANGSFSKIDDIMNVSGIGEAVFAKIKDNITV